MGLFLGLYIFSIDLCVCFLMPMLNCFDYYNFETSFEIRKHDASSFVLLSQDCFGCLGSHVVPYRFYICYISVESAIGILIGMTLNLYIALGSMGIFNNTNSSNP